MIDTSKISASLEVVSNALKVVATAVDDIRDAVADDGQPDPPGPPPVRGQFGFNVGHSRYWSTCWPFNNLWKTMSLYVNRGSEEPTFNELGHMTSPTTVKATLLTHGGQGVPYGKYVLSIKRELARPTLREIDIQEDRVNFEITGPFQSVTLKSASAPISVFSPSFSRRANSARCIRWMNQLNVNSTWNDNHPYVIRDWMPGRHNVFFHLLPGWNDIVLASNLHGCDAWVNLHHSMNDDDVIHAALMLKNINAGIRVYVETANEVWNPGFPGMHHYGTGGTSWMKPYASAASRNAQLFKEVLGDRAVGVIGGQSANSWIAGKLLSYCDLEYIDALAIAPYFGGPPVRNLSSDDAAVITSDEVMAIARADFEGRVKGQADANRKVADLYDVELIGYEGGSHLRRDKSGEEGIFEEASQSPAMGELYEEYLDWWSGLTDGVLCLYRDVGIDCWGHKRYEHSSSPRWSAVMAHMQQQATQEDILP